MKQFLLSLTLFCLLPNLQAQSYQPTAEREFKSLVGKIYILPFFMDTQVSSWTEEEAKDCLTQLQESEDWIVAQSAPYNVETSFSNDFIPSKDEVITIDSAQSNIL